VVTVPGKKQLGGEKKKKGIRKHDKPYPGGPVPGRETRALSVEVEKTNRGV